MTVERVNALDRAKMLNFYKQRFSERGGLHFFMVGRSRLDEAVPLVARYVGGPALDGTASSDFKDLGIKFPPQRRARRSRRGASRRARP
jgi:hypothetical protein